MLQIRGQLIAVLGAVVIDNVPETVGVHTAGALEQDRVVRARK